jgi:hypothetical protein
MFRDKFRKYVGEMADWDEMLFSMEQIHFYKGNSNGQPLALFSFYINDSIPDGYFVYTEFNEEGRPEYMNFNDSNVMMISNVYGEYYNAVVINSDMSSFSVDSIPMPESLNLRAWDDLTPAQRANATMNSYLGGFNMAMGGAAMIWGCAMLVPGANIVVGATIALAGAATFLSGAFMVARASDQMLSDGSNTQYFDMYADVFGLAGTALGAAAAGSAVQAAANVAYDVFTEGVEATGDLMLNRENEALNAARERAQQIRSMELSATGRATLLDLESSSVRLFGNVTGKLDPNDWFGILVCKDKEALTIDYCQPLDPSHPTGSFYCDFSGLEPCQGYYYRSYYYSHELGNLGFNPEVVSTQKSFKMPGVITLVHEQGNYSNSYWLHGKFQDVANQPTHTVGFCYSYTNEEPTYDDETIQQTVYDNGEFSGHLFMDSSYEACFYRAYAFINGEIAYGEVRQISSSERECLMSIYNATNGVNWTNQNNWGSARPISEWYGVVFENGHVVSLNLNNNNLSGNFDISCLPYLNNLNISNNALSSIAISNTSISNIELSNCITNYGSMSISGISSVEISNIPAMGQISCYCDSLLVTNCQFGSINGPFGGVSCSKAIIDNCYMYNCYLSSPILIFRNSTTYNTWYCVTSQKLVIENSYCSTICSGDFYDNTLIILNNATLWRSNWDENSLITVTRTIRGSQWDSLFGD